MSQSAMIVLAGGRGTRFRADKPKQLAMLAGKTILEHLLANLAGCADLKQIIVVGRAEILDEIKSIATRVAPDRIKVVVGGANRLTSTRAGLQAVEGPDATKVLIHDGVRPFLKHSIIRNCLSALDTYEAVDVVIPSADTLVQVNADHPDIIGQIPQRSHFRRGQTPQGFWLGKFRAVIAGVPDLETATFTDDCGMYLAVHPKVAIGLVDGDETNLKITHPIDLFIAEQLIMSGQTTEVAHVDAVDLAGKTMVVFGANSGLGADAKTALEARGINVIGTSRRTGCNIAEDQQVASFFAQVARDHGAIDAVMNFAGVLHIGKLAESDAAQIAEIVHTNYQGVLNVARHAHPYLKDSLGQLVLVSSSSYYRGRSDYAAYSSSKAAVVNITQALAEEWADDSIRVNCIVPRRANTQMRWTAFPGEDPQSLLQPEEVSTALIQLLKSTNTGLINHVY